MRQPQTEPFLQAPPRHLSGISVTLPATTNRPVTTPVVLASAPPVKPGCLPPTATRNSPGSITRLPASSISDICVGVTVNETFCFSPGFRKIRLVPANDLIGTGTEED